MRIAYLTNQYPKISHTFIRREIDAVVRADSSLEVFRYSIRPTPDRLLDPADIAEQKITDVVLSHGFLSLLLATLKVLLTRPFKFFGAFLLAMRLGRRGRQGCLWHLFYLAEAAWLLLQFQAKQISHVHVHFGTNPATVALLCRVLGGPTYSFTVHGPEEFDCPESLHLRTKIEHCAFVVAVSSFGRSQLCRWATFQRLGQDPRCSLRASFRRSGPDRHPLKIISDLYAWDGSANKRDNSCSSKPQRCCMMPG
jgi:colanic acid/amylovoran biosynthesis glycosyltransferase